MRLQPRPLPPSAPCPYCTGERTAAALAEHNRRCAESGERSYLPFVRTAVRAFVAGLFVAGCGHTPTGPSRTCPDGFVRDTTAVLEYPDVAVVSVAACVRPLQAWRP